MASRILNRRELRKQSDQVEQVKAGVTDTAATLAVSERAAKRKSAVAAVRRPRKPKVPPRMKAMWCIYDGGMKEIALFEYNQRATAEARLAVLLGKPKGVYFLQIVKQPMPAAEPAEGRRVLVADKS
jgi:hypothetical protein